MNTIDIIASTPRAYKTPIYTRNASTAYYSRNKEAILLKRRMKKLSMAMVTQVVEKEDLNEDSLGKSDPTTIEMGLETFS